MEAQGAADSSSAQVMDAQAPADAPGDREARKRRRAERRQENASRRTPTEQAEFEEQQRQRNEERRHAKLMTRAAQSSVSSASSPAASVILVPDRIEEASRQPVSGEVSAAAASAAASVILVPDTIEEAPRQPGGAGAAAQLRAPQRGWSRRVPAALSARVCALEKQLRRMLHCTLTFSSQARKAKRGVPSTPLTVTAVRRQKDRFVLTLEGKDPNGTEISYRHVITTEDDIADRFILGGGVEVVPMTATSFSDFFSPSVSAAEQARREVRESLAAPLCSILPKFQFRGPQPGHDLTFDCIGDPFDAELTHLLACECQLFHSQESCDVHGLNVLQSNVQGTIWRARTGDGRFFDTNVEEVRKSAQQLLEMRYMREEVSMGRTEVPEHMRSVGGQPLFPWQAWLFAEFQAMTQQSETMSSVLVTRTRARTVKGCAAAGVVGAPAAHEACVQGIAQRPQKLVVCVAAPGDGKTRVGALCAHGRKACVVVVGATMHHWENEASMLGVQCVLVGSNSGYVRPADLKNKLEQTEGGLMWIVTRATLNNYLKSSSSARDLSVFPVPDILIIDEFHEHKLKQAPLNARKLLASWPTAVALGFTGTFPPQAVEEVAQEIGWDAEVLEGVTVRVPAQAIKGQFPQVEAQVKRIQMSSLEMACYDAGRRWMTWAERQRLLIFAPSDDQGRSERYGAEVWKTIIAQLQKAEKEVYSQLAKIIKHVLVESRKEAVLNVIKDELGDAAATSIRLAAAVLPPALAQWGPAEVDRSVQGAFAKRKAILGGYTFLIRQLDSVSAASEIECPVCLDKSTQWSIAQCGHVVCSECAERTELRARCPTCRKNDPCWKSAAQLAALRKQTRGDDGSAEAAEECLDTSNKLKALGSLLLKLAHAERALVICPQQLLGAVATEMRRININLGILSGGSVEQERTLAVWTKGKTYKGLLAPPGVMGVDIHASTIIFLTVLMTETEFRQALARVKRQGNPVIAKGLPVKVWLLACSETEEDAAANLQDKIRIAEEGNSYVREAPLSEPSSSSTGRR